MCGLEIVVRNLGEFLCGGKRTELTHGSWYGEEGIWEKAGPRLLSRRLPSARDVSSDGGGPTISGFFNSNPSTEESMGGKLVPSN